VCEIPRILRSEKRPIRLAADKPFWTKFWFARHPDIIDAGFDEVFAKKLNVKLKLDDCLVPVFLVADLPH